MRRAGRVASFALLAIVAGVAPAAAADRSVPIGRSTLAETDAVTTEVSTEELEEILAAGSAAVLDVRSAREHAIAHIPGSVNVWEKEIEQIVERYPDRTAALVLYCNGPYCGKSRRTSAELLKRGYANVPPVSARPAGVARPRAHGADRSGGSPLRRRKRSHGGTAESAVATLKARTR